MKTTVKKHSKGYDTGSSMSIKSAGKTEKTVKLSRLPGDGNARKSGKKSGSKGGMKY